MATNLFDIDPLALYFGDDYVINDFIKIAHPTIRDIRAQGERSYFSTVHTLTAIPSDVKSMLWDDLKLDWQEVEDFTLFQLLARTLPPERTGVLFGDLDFTKMKVMRNQENDEIVMRDPETGVVIDKLIYMRIVNYLRKLHNITPKVEKAKNKHTRELLIELDRQDKTANANKEYKSFLLPLISSVKNRMGYTKDYILNEGIVEFMDDVKRLQVINHADHLLAGCYSGMIDTKKINKKDLDWMKSLDNT